MSTADFRLEPHDDYAARCRAFLEFSIHADTRAGREAIVSQTARLALQRGPVDEGIMREALAFVEARHDCSDFVVASLLRILYQYAQSPLLAPELVAATGETVRHFKYWITDPGHELMCFWSENHQLGFFASEYLAGQRYPEAEFSNTGRSGRWHGERARPKLLRWIDMKARFGFSEWDSNTYHRINVLNLLNLVDFAEDEEVSTRARMMLDLIFFDMAVDSFQGIYGCSHGRTYPQHLVSARREATSGLQRIAWGMGAYSDPHDGASLFLAVSPKYRVAHVIEKLAQEMPDELVNRERHGIAYEDAAGYDYNADDPDDAMLLWSAGQFSAGNIEKSLAWAETFNSRRFHVVIRPYAEALLGTYKALEEQGTPFDGDLERTALRPVNKYTYRTPDYQLASAQDYRKGLPGFQQHIWQATLGPDTILFTLHRGSASDESYKYWVGRYPRAVQHKNLLVALYDVPVQPLPGPKTIYPPDAEGNAMPSPGPAEEELVPRTVAVFRRAAFDEVLEREGWVFGRQGSGYVALRSQQPYRWTEDGVLQGEGLVAEGRRNVWICHMGRQAVDGPFDSWAERIARTPLTFGDLQVHYRAPGVGEVSLAWDGPLMVDGQEIGMGPYPRFDNPYCQAAYGTRRFQIEFAGQHLNLDFSTA